MDKLSTIADRLEFSMLEQAGGDPQESIKTTMANICEISVQAVHDWFNGKTKSPKAEHIARIGNFCEVDIYWLITGKEGKPIAKPRNGHAAEIPQAKSKGHTGPERRDNQYRREEDRSASATVKKR